MQKKAEVPSMLFVFIIGVVVLGVVLAIGYKTFFSFKSGQDKQEIVEFRQQLQNDLTIAKTDFESERVKTYPLPKRITKVCFTNVASKEELPLDFQEEYPLAADAVNAGYNVFLFSDQTEMLKIEGMHPQIELFCLDNQNGQIKLAMKGDGDTIMLEGIDASELPGQENNEILQNLEQTARLLLDGDAQLNQNITLETITDPVQNANVELVSDVIVINPQELALDEPAELILDIDTEQVEDPNTVYLLQLENDSWQRLETQVRVNTDEQTATATIETLGTFAMAIGSAQNATGATPCTMNGEDQYPSGQTWMFYDINESNEQGECKGHGQNRTCVNAVWSGDDAYHFYSCKEPTPSCIFNGKAVENGESVTAYQAATVPYGSQCALQKRTCANEALSGNYAFPECTVLPRVNTALTFKINQMGGLIGNSMFSGIYTASGGTPPYNFLKISGELPLGISAAWSPDGSFSLGGIIRSDCRLSWPCALHQSQWALRDSTGLSVSFSVDFSTYKPNYPSFNGFAEVSVNGHPGNTFGSSYNQVLLRVGEPATIAWSTTGMSSCSLTEIFVPAADMVSYHPTSTTSVANSGSMVKTAMNVSEAGNYYFMLTCNLIGGGTNWAGMVYTVVP